MKQMMKWLAPAALLLAGGTGCVTLQTQEEIDAQNQRMAAMEMNVQSLQGQTQQLQAQVEELRQDNALSASQARSLREAVGLLDKRFDQVDETSRQRMAQIQSKLAEESKLRAEAIKSQTDAVAKAMAENNKQWQEQLKKMQSALRTTAATPTTQGEYVVQKGDTLAAIAQAFNVSVTALQRANGLKTATVAPGKKLIIPAAAGATRKKTTK